MAITFEDGFSMNGSGGIGKPTITIIGDEDNSSIILYETEAVQVRDELLRRYPLEKADAPKPAEPAPLSLEVGKWYRRRDGEVVQIVVERSKTLWPFECSRRLCYAPNGRYALSNDPIGKDLIAEVPAPGKADGASKQEGHDSAGAKAAAAAAIDAEKLPVDLDAEMFENDQLRKKIVALEAKIHNLNKALKALIGE